MTSSYPDAPAGSVLSFPDRGPWGKASWRGNMSGHVMRGLFGWLKPDSFVDPMVGSGTSVEVANELGIEAYGLDLHSGFNILRQSIRDTIGKEVSMAFCHPAYFDMVVYSGEVWGNAPHPDDLSRCESVEDFLAKLQIALLNQREAVRPGGVYGMLIGDQRKQGRYYSYQGEMISRMPRDELLSVLIKQQHGTMSGRKSYANFSAPRILHEYILLWQKPKQVTLLINTLAGIANQQHRALRDTWVSVIKTAMIDLGGTAALPQLYERVSGIADEDRKASNPHWRDKVRQVLQRNPAVFSNTARGVWALAA